MLGALLIAGEYVIPEVALLTSKVWAGYKCPLL